VSFTPADVVRPAVAINPLHVKRSCCRIAMAAAAATASHQLFVRNQGRAITCTVSGRDTIADLKVQIRVSCGNASSFVAVALFEAPRMGRQRRGTPSIVKESCVVVGSSRITLALLNTAWAGSLR